MARVLEVDAEAAAEERTRVPARVLGELEIKVIAEEILDILAVQQEAEEWAELAETLQMEEMLQSAAAVLISTALCMRLVGAVALILQVLVAAVTAAAVLVELVVITVALVEETLEAEAVVVDAAARRAVRVDQAK